MAKVYQSNSPALNWDMDRYYARSSRLSMIVSLSLILAAFLIMPKEFEITPYALRKDVAIIMEELPLELDKIAEPPPVERPKLPVATNSPDQVEAATIDRTDVIESIRKITEVEPPTVPFWKVEVKPQLEHMPSPIYPELARLANIEGKVVVEALVDIDGRIIDTRILKPSGNTALDQAAIQAARKAIFTPAKQRDKLVRVWVAIPFEFKLTGR
ncbi:MAG: energy transducer TonB [bacterium]